MGVFICNLEDKGSDAQALQGLLEQLTKDGYKITQEGPHIVIEYNPGDIKKQRTRNAGRKTKLTGKSCRDIYLYRQDHSQKETAEMLGVNVRTYQRMEQSVKAAQFFEDSQTAADVVFGRLDAIH